MDRGVTVKRLYEAINAGDMEIFDDVVADDFVEHEELPGLEPSKEGVRAFFESFLAAFPDLRMEPVDILESGDKVVARVKVTGTNQGEFLGAPATGKAIDVQLIDIIRVGDDGLAHEHWGVMDQLTMLQQLGLAPEGPPG
jgi:steroid delta-isomerase-like uncharacterized protein